MSKKVVTLAVIVTLVLGLGTAFATPARMETLGNQDLYLVDDSNFFTNPAVMSYYRNCALLHMGGLEGGDVSAIGAMSLAIGDPLTLVLTVGGPGALVALTERSIGSIKADAIMGGAFVDYFGVLPGPIPPNDIDTSTMNPFGVLLAYKMGDMSIGFEYRYLNGKYNDKDDIAETELDQAAVTHDVHLGFSGKFGDMQPEAWLHLTPYWVRSEYSDDDADYDSEQKLSGMKYMLGGRLLYAYSDKITIVPAINWEHATGDVELDTDDDLNLTFQGESIDEEDLGQSYVVDSIETGINVQYHEGGFFGLLITGSVGLKWSRWARELEVDSTDFSSTLTSKSFAVPTAALGIEFWPNDIFCFRGGIDTTTLWASSTSINEEDDVDGDTTDDDSLMQTVQSTRASVGVGLHFGNLLIDATFGNWFLANEDGNTGLHGGPNVFSHLDAKVRW